jgi:hypothetical protein
VALHGWQNAERGINFGDGYSSGEIETEGALEEQLQMNPACLFSERRNKDAGFQISWREGELKDQYS